MSFIDFYDIFWSSLGNSWQKTLIDAPNIQNDIFWLNFIISRHNTLIEAPNLQTSEMTYSDWISAIRGKNVNWGSKSPKWHILIEFQHFATLNVDWGSKSPNLRNDIFWSSLGNSGQISQMTYSVRISAFRDTKRWLRLQISKMSFIDIRKWLRLQISKMSFIHIQTWLRLQIS